MAKPKVTDSTGVARRRRRLRIWLAVLLTGTAVGLGLYFYPYPPLPAAETEAARTALQQARREAASLAPQPLARAVKAAVAMERLYAYDRSRWFRFTRLEALDRSIADLDRIVYQMVAERRDQGGQGDLLSMLLDARDEEGDGGAMSDRQVRDEALTLLLAGHETTANALTWSWYLLSQNPDCADELHAERESLLLPAAHPARLRVAHARVSARGQTQIVQ